MLRSPLQAPALCSSGNGRPAVIGRGRHPPHSALTVKSLKTAPSSTAESNSTRGGNAQKEDASQVPAPAGRVNVVELNGEVTTCVYSSKQAGPAVPGEAAAPQSQPVQGEEANIPNRALQALREWFLPAGYPASTTPDYLEYQLYTFPTHVLGWLAHSLTTSSLLSAVGLSSGPVGTVATSAGIKWITKDGIGTLGRFFVGGQLAQEFDDDPRFWRMSAEYIATAGAALEIATVAYPQSFLLLASAGNFTHALSKSIGRPVFRVIHNHFAATNNVGAVAAKEEVWEVSAELVGTVGSLALLNALASLPNDGSVDKAAVTVGTWAAMQTMHVLLRYRALKSLCFPSLSEKRTRLLVTQHVLGLPMSNVDEANRKEPMFEIGGPWVPFPKVHIGTESVQQCLQGVSFASPLQQESSSYSSSSSSSSGGGGGGAGSSLNGNSLNGRFLAESSSSSTAGSHEAQQMQSIQQMSTQQEAHTFSVRAASLPSSTHSDAASSHTSATPTNRGQLESAHSSLTHNTHNSASPSKMPHNGQHFSHLPSGSPSPPSMSSSAEGASTHHIHATRSISHNKGPVRSPASTTPHDSPSPQACSTAQALQHYLTLYDRERYALVWKGGAAHVLLHEGAGPLDVLQAMWQTAWIHHRGEEQQHHVSPSSSSSSPAAAPQLHHSRGSSNSVQAPQQLPNEGEHGPNNHALEAASLAAARAHFPAFLKEVQALGYRLDQVTVHRGKVRVRVASQPQQ